MSNKILVVEDEEAIRNLLVRWLTDAGFNVSSVATGTDAVDALKAFEPSVVLMDIQLPGKDGFELVEEIRTFSGVPIIMVTANSSAEAMDKAFAAHADDFFPKSPWEPEKLMARIKNALNFWKTPVVEATALKIGPVVLDIPGHEVRKNGEKVSLTPLEFKLLATLAADPTIVFSREKLLQDVWDYPYQGDTRLVNVHIQRLRSKIEDDPDNPTIVVTVRGIGYKAGLN